MDIVELYIPYSMWRILTKNHAKKEKDGMKEGKQLLLQHFIPTQKRSETTLASQLKYFSDKTGLQLQATYLQFYLGANNGLPVENDLLNWTLNRFQGLENNAGRGGARLYQFHFYARATHRTPCIYIFENIVYRKDLLLSDDLLTPPTPPFRQDKIDLYYYSLSLDPSMIYALPFTKPDRMYEKAIVDFLPSITFFTTEDALVVYFHQK